MLSAQADFAAKIVADHNDTFEFCSGLYDSVMCEHYTYRPNDGLMASRNAYLTQAMHYRSHQMEY